MTRLMQIDCASSLPTTDSFPSFEGLKASTGDGSFSIDSTLKRSGRGAFKYSTSGSSGTSYSRISWGLRGNLGYYVRFYLMREQVPDSPTWVATLATDANHLVAIRFTATGKLQLWNNIANSQIGSDSDAIFSDPNIYHRIELYCKTSSGANDEAALLVNGTTVASATGLSLSDSNISHFFFGFIQNPGSNKNIYIDDIAVNDDVGSVQNSYPGSGRVYYLLPNTDNANPGGWVGGAGGTTNLFEAVNNLPPIGVAPGSATDLSQIKCTSGTSQNYDATMETYDSTNFYGLIKILQIVTIFGASGTSGRNDAFKLVSNPVLNEQSMTQSGGSIISTYGSNWATKWGTPELNPTVIKNISPIVRVSRQDSTANDLHVCLMLISFEIEDVVAPSSHVKVR